MVLPNGRNLYRIFGAFMTHAMIVSRKFAAKMSNEKIHNHIDLQLNFYRSLKRYTIYPPVSIQLDQFENSSQMNTKYPELFFGPLTKVSIGGTPTTLHYAFNSAFYRINNYDINILTFLLIIIGLIVGRRRAPILFIILFLIHIPDFSAVKNKRPDQFTTSIVNTILPTIVALARK